MEFIAALVFGSASLFMDALSTSLDIVSSLGLLLGFKLAARPPDLDHPLGHGRYEPLAGLQIGLFLVFLGAGMFFYNTVEITQPDPYTAIHPLLWLIPGLSIVLLEIGYRSLINTSKKTHSPALAADAVHYRIDSITSFLAMVALLLGSYAPKFSQIFDHIGAALIAVFMMVIGFNAARKNMNQLLDRIPEKDYFDRIRAAAERAQGVKGTEKIRMQLYGPDAHVAIDVEVEPHLTVEAAHKISQNVRVEIQKELPQVRDVIVHMEPYYPNDH
jgi:cation diffusion facilitator family transporter